MATAFAEGKALLAESKYLEAIEKFTLALKTSPTSPDYLIQRSTAYQRAKQFDNALADAETAIVHATTRAKRELILQGQLRRGIAFYHLERYGDAKFCIELVKTKDPKEKSVDMWLNKTASKLDALETGDEKAQITAEATPVLKKPDAVKATKPNDNVKTSTTPAQAPPTGSRKIRYDWYQDDKAVNLDIYKPQGEPQVDLQADSISVTFTSGDRESNYSLFTVDPFYARIDVSSSTVSTLTSKIQCRLVKAVPGKWHTLEGTEPLDAATPTAPPIITKGPAYPTSSRSGPKNWDQIVSEEPAATEDDAGGDDATKFFKKLFKDASPETQRAMMKSYTESNGTALSTDWSEVSKAKVKTVPPDGMESKTWSS